MVSVLVSVSQIQEVPPKNVILLVGPPGSGKSTFCQQAVLRRLAVGRPVIFVTTEYGPSEAEKDLREKGLGGVEPGLLNFIDAYNETVGLSVSDRPDTVRADSADLSSIGVAISKLQERIGKTSLLLVFDSLTSPYLLGGPEVVRFVRLTLSRFAREGNSVLACFDEGSGKEEDLVGMMSLSDGVVRMKIEKDRELLDVVKHPEVRPTRIELPVQPERLGIVARIWDPDMTKQVYQANVRGDRSFFRKELGDFVNLFWPNLVPWSGLLWDPKRFPVIFYEVNKDDGPGMSRLMEEDEAYKRMYPWQMKLFMKLFMPKSFSKVKDMKKLIKYLAPWYRREGEGILEYLGDVSKTDEHYVRVHENFNCWGFDNVGATMASYLPAMIAGWCISLEYQKGLDRDWNAVETKCIGLGDPYCEIKLVPGEIDELTDTLEKDVSVLERIHDRLMHRLMGFLLHRKTLVERPGLGSDVHLHPVWHTMGSENIPAMGRVWAERYKMALRMGGAKAGKEVGEHLTEAGIGEEEAVSRVVHLLEHCKAAKVAVGETIRMKENCENAFAKLLAERLKEPSCFFTTGFLNGFFSTVEKQHVKETKCIAMGDPYCEWEFR